MTNVSLIIREPYGDKMTNRLPRGAGASLLPLAAALSLTVIVPHVNARLIMNVNPGSSSDNHNINDQNSRNSNDNQVSEEQPRSEWNDSSKDKQLGSRRSLRNSYPIGFYDQDAINIPEESERKQAGNRHRNFHDNNVNDESLGFVVFDQLNDAFERKLKLGGNQASGSSKQLLQSNARKHHSHVDSRVDSLHFSKIESSLRAINHNDHINGIGNNQDWHPNPRNNQLLNGNPNSSDIDPEMIDLEVLPGRAGMNSKLNSNLNSQVNSRVNSRANSRENLKEVPEQIDINHIAIDNINDNDHGIKPTRNSNNNNILPQQNINAINSKGVVFAGAMKKLPKSKSRGKQSRRVPQQFANLNLAVRIKPEEQLAGNSPHDAKFNKYIKSLQPDGLMPEGLVGMSGIDDQMPFNVASEVRGIDDPRNDDPNKVSKNQREVIHSKFDRGLGNANNGNRRNEVYLGVAKDGQVVILHDDDQPDANGCGRGQVDDDLNEVHDFPNRNASSSGCVFSSVCKKYGKVCALFTCLGLVGGGATLGSHLNRKYPEMFMSNMDILEKRAATALRVCGGSSSSPTVNGNESVGMDADWAYDEVMRLAAEVANPIATADQLLKVLTGHGGKCSGCDMSHCSAEFGAARSTISRGTINSSTRTISSGGGSQTSQAASGMTTNHNTDSDTNSCSQQSLLAKCPWKQPWNCHNAPNFSSDTQRCWADEAKFVCSAGGIHDASWAANLVLRAGANTKAGFEKFKELESGACSGCEITDENLNLKGESNCAWTKPWHCMQSREESQRVHNRNYELNRSFPRVSENPLDTCWADLAGAKCGESAHDLVMSTGTGGNTEASYRAYRSIRCAEPSSLPSSSLISSPPASVPSESQPATSSSVPASGPASSSAPTSRPPQGVPVPPSSNSGPNPPSPIVIPLNVHGHPINQIAPKPSNSCPCRPIPPKDFLDKANISFWWPSRCLSAATNEPPWCYVGESCRDPDGFSNLTREETAWKYCESVGDEYAVPAVGDALGDVSEGDNDVLGDVSEGDNGDRDSDGN